MFALLLGSCAIDGGELPDQSAIITDGRTLLNSFYDRLETAAAEEPALARVDTIGFIPDGADGSSFAIKRIIITGNSEQATMEPEDRPRILITGAVHGDEPISAGIAVQLAEYLIDAYASADPRAFGGSEVSEDPGDFSDSRHSGGFRDSGAAKVRALLDSSAVHIVPVVNPWGLVHDSRRTESGVDINRDFGYPEPDPEEWAAYELNDEWFHPWVLGFQAAESRILRTLCKEELYLFSIQGHNGAENINLPMDYLEFLRYFNTDADPVTPESASYLDTYIPIYPIMEQYADTYAAALADLPGYNDFYATEGADWYIADGTFTDWHFGALGAPGFTIEYDTRKGWITGSQMDTVWNAHRDALIDLLAIHRHRVSGEVVDTAVDRLSFSRVDEAQSRGLRDPTPIVLTARVNPSTRYFHILMPDGSWSPTRISHDGTEETIADILVDSSQQDSLPVLL